MSLLSATNEFKISQIVDNGQMIQLTLIENVSTEPISQKQMIIENVAKKLDSETKEQIIAFTGSNSNSSTNSKCEKLSANSNYNGNAQK